MSERHMEACARLTPDEAQTLVMLSLGMRSREVGAQLGVARDTIKSRARIIRAKLGVNTITQAAVIAAKAGIV